jgi:hypothetical protein
MSDAVLAVKNLAALGVSCTCGLAFCWTLQLLSIPMYLLHCWQAVAAADALCCCVL